MKKRTWIAGVAILTSAFSATADHGSSYTVTVPVVSVDPVISARTERVAREYCEPEVRTVRRGRSDDRAYGRSAWGPPGHWPEDTRRHGDGGDAVATLLGGLIGGAIGRQFGGGSGRDAMTVVGAVAGASIAANASRSDHDHDYSRDYRDRRDRSRNRERSTVYREHCRIVDDVREVRVIEAWDVTYLYNGREFTRRMPDRPGDHVELRVQVEPVESPRGHALAHESDYI